MLWFGMDEVDFLQSLAEFGAEFEDQVAAGEGSHADGGAIEGVGGVVESVGLPEIADEAGGSGSGEVADGEGAVTVVGLVEEGEEDAVDETDGETMAGGGVITRVFVKQVGGGEDGESADGVAAELGTVNAAVGGGAVAPVVGVIGGRTEHGVAGAEGRDDEGSGAEDDVGFKGETFFEGHGSGGGGRT